MSLSTTSTLLHKLSWKVWQRAWSNMGTIFSSRPPTRDKTNVPRLWVSYRPYLGKVGWPGIWLLWPQQSKNNLLSHYRLSYISIYRQSIYNLHRDFYGFTCTQKFACASYHQTGHKCSDFFSIDSNYDPPTPPLEFPCLEQDRRGFSDIKSNFCPL